MKKTVPSIQFKRKRSPMATAQSNGARPAAAATAAPMRRPAPKPSGPRRQPANGRAPAKAVSTQPKDVQMAELREILTSSFPQAFGATIPLKIGIHKDIWRQLPEVDHCLLDDFLRKYTGQSDYLDAMAQGGVRFDLEGHPVEPISEHARSLSSRRLSTYAKRRQPTV